MRQSGILLHMSSLPSPYGIGTLGKAAYRFMDFLKKAGQSCWQMLPINPTGYGDSPYQALSTFAGNPYLIDLERLVEEGLLQPEEILDKEWGENPARVDFSFLYQQRLPLLYKAFLRFDRQKNPEYENFIQEQKWWLEDFALFMALKKEHDQAPWTEWEDGVRLRKPDAIKACRKRLNEQMEFHFFLQYTFYRQWESLHRYAGEQGISLIGDVPIYVPMDSADVWVAPDHFQLDANRMPVIIAGCPPDAFSAVGQRWGNPIYDWKRMEQDGFDWWISRLRVAAHFFDTVRIDHFRGIESYWAIPAEEETAVKGEWRKGPGMNLIRAIHKSLPHAHFIAEDLGFLTPEVIQMQKESGFPGMKVLQFAFDSREAGNYLPFTYTRNSVCYTGTHDNETLLQWQQMISKENLQYAMDYLQLQDESRIPEAMICCGMASVSDLFVAQMQDYLGLGAEARMNKPSTLNSQNWTWRVLEEQFTDELAEEICRLTKLYGRYN